MPVAEIADPKNDYNLNLPRYIDSTEPEDLQDIDAHLRGGIPERDLDALAPYWKVIPGVRAVLFRQKAELGLGAPGNAEPQLGPQRKIARPRGHYSELRVPPSEVKSAILNHPNSAPSTTPSRSSSRNGKRPPCRA